MKLVSNGPNIQSIPRRTEEIRKLRAGLVAQDEFKLLQLDYADLEVRAIAIELGKNNG